MPDAPRLLDVHGHFGRVLFDRRECIDTANLLAKMDAWGIARSCLLALSEHPEGAYLGSDTEDVIQACAVCPTRLTPFCLVDPRYGNRPDMDYRPLLEEHKARGCRGIGEFLPKLDADHPMCLTLYRQAGELDLPVLFDMNDSPWGYGLRDEPGLPGLEHALQDCPATVFIGHGPTFWAEIAPDTPPDQRTTYPGGPVRPGGAVPRLLRRYPNLWADTSAGSGYNALSRDPAFGLEFMDEFQDRLLFGIDSCRRSDVDAVPPIVALFRDLRAQRRLGADALDKIGWRNATRLLKL